MEKLVSTKDLVTEFFNVVIMDGTRYLYVSHRREVIARNEWVIILQVEETGKIEEIGIGIEDLNELLWTIEPY